MRHILCFLLLFLANFGWATPHSAFRADNNWAGFPNLKSLHIFGDSYSRTGFDPSGTQPSFTNPLGNPSYPGRTSSNGPNWAGYLTTKYNDSSILAYNFAGSGATLDKSIVDNNGYDVIREIDEGYLRYYGNDTIESSTSLFVVWIGINDITNSYLERNDTTHSSIFKSFRYRIDSLYDTGARNFLLLSIPPLERAPRTTQSSDAENRVPLMKDAVQDWNERLRIFKQRIQYLHSDVNVFLFDTYSLFQKVIDDPAQYEETAVYKDTATGTDEIDTKLDECEFAANEYLWLNSMHPTSPIHEVLAKQVAKVLKAQ
ncbi:unnamed protein product [Clonostachys chloroleuca]|uniref:Acetylesterase n=1 Tax=Clonostachys chloroleuca TaxID=1926264 RepID=A0AA35PWT9_9HYPO|nr:unnamed protein product [Clonostachys chloroleuca]